jgi:plastocyanin
LNQQNIIADENKMRQNLRFLSAIGLLLWLTGCYSAPAVTANISVTIKDNSYQPSAWRIPAGVMITLHLDNQDSVRHDWIILIRQAVIPFNSDDEASTFWKYSIEGGKSEVIQFKAPAAAGDYPVVDAKYLADGMAGVITVVQPEQISQ